MSNHWTIPNDAEGKLLLVHLYYAISCDIKKISKYELNFPNENLDRAKKIKTRLFSVQESEDELDNIFGINLRASRKSVCKYIVIDARSVDTLVIDDFKVDQQTQKLCDFTEKYHESLFKIVRPEVASKLGEGEFCAILTSLGIPQAPFQRVAPLLGEQPHALPMVTDVDREATAGGDAQRVRRPYFTGQNSIEDLAKLTVAIEPQGGNYPTLPGGDTHTRLVLGKMEFGEQKWTDENDRTHKFELSHCKLRLNTQNAYLPSVSGYGDIHVDSVNGKPSLLLENAVGGGPTDSEVSWNITQDSETRIRGKFETVALAFIDGFPPHTLAAQLVIQLGHIIPIPDPDYDLSSVRKEGRKLALRWLKGRLSNERHFDGEIVISGRPAE